MEVGCGPCDLLLYAAAVFCGLCPPFPLRCVRLGGACAGSKAI